MSIYLRNVFRFILLVLIQVLLLNKIPLRWWSNPGGLPPYTPYIYPLFILLLPLSTPVPFLLIVSFTMGITIDAFMDTGGMHAAACVLMAFFRTNVLTLLLPKRIAEYQNMSPNTKSMGWTPFMTYAAILLALHHVFFYIIEIWSFHSIGYMLMKILISLLTSLVFVALYSLFFSSSIGTVYYDK
ncbi:rod shape-determining protein MreD [Taibaiella koreensis]|uniref:rod shape-determining protein MreD n=1 Tax=Taibaiella koreensis TaxID=1268548 RepID=UPI000E5A032D|nr:rod shape-determining protein MreD [Taibaiella koreensis]